MKTKQSNTYHCEYCNKYYIRKHFAERHEQYCRNNPANKHKCFQYCTNLEKTKEDAGEAYPRDITCFRCKVTKEYMFSYIAERRDIFVEDAIRMPLECEHYDENLGF